MITIRPAAVFLIVLAVSLVQAETPVVNQSARQVPVVAVVDVLVVGGSTGAVQAALSAAEAGGSVFLIAPYPYLGDDMTATLQLWLEPGEVPTGPLAKKVYSDPVAEAAQSIAATTADTDEKLKLPRPMPRPLHVKRVLDEALIDAGVPFLFSCYPTELVRDREGNIRGVVMANRAGRQVILAKTIIDASQRAVVARLAGGQFGPYPGGQQTLRRVVIGGTAKDNPEIIAREILPSFVTTAGKKPEAYPVYEYTLRLPIDHDDIQSWAAAEIKAQGLTYDPGQQFASDAFSFVPPNHIRGMAKAQSAEEGVDAIPLDAFRPAKVDNLYVLSGYADVPSKVAARLQRPIALMDVGRRVGKVAADRSKQIPRPALDAVAIPGTPAAEPVVGGDIGERLKGIRPSQQWPTIDQQSGSLPVLGEYDVVIIGGGTSGSPAGIAGGRHGMETLVVEYQHGLGGVGTLGAISKYYHGNIAGFSKKVAGGKSWAIEQKKEWWCSQLQKAGTEVWYGTIGCGAFTENKHIRGAVVATPFGRGVVLAKVVIDATGNADVAAAAGAPCVHVDQSEFAVQGTGLGSRELGASYENTDFTWSDETDLMDVWRMYVHAKDKYPEAFDQQKVIDTRERRRIVGDFMVRVTDQFNGRTYPDSVVRARSNYDTHGYTVDPCLLAEHPLRRDIYSYVPYRCLLPKGFDGLLVAGIGMSVHRDALPLVRMQPDIQNQGYVAGTAAAVAIKMGVEPRNIDVKRLQRHLVKIGNLPKSVLTDSDSYPIPDPQLEKAVSTFAKSESGKGASILCADPKRARPMVRKAFEATSDQQERRRLAKLLCILGDAGGLDVVMRQVSQSPQWDKGWNFMAMGQFGYSMSDQDALIVAMGMTGDRRAVPVILDKMKSLTSKDDFSHFRAVGLALETLRDPQATAPLAELLRKPDMTGYAQTSLERVRELDPTREVSLGAIVSRRVSLRELALARALYRCGDHEGLGKAILNEYAKDLRGHLAQHAKAVLAEGEE